MKTQTPVTNRDLTLAPVRHQYCAVISSVNNVVCFWKSSGNEVMRVDSLFMCLK